MLDEADRAAARSGLTQSREDTVRQLCAALADARRGTHTDVAVTTVGAVLDGVYRRALLDARRTLAAETGMSTRRLGTDNGVLAVLADLGHRCTDVPEAHEIDHLTGTAAALALRRLLLLRSEHRQLTTRLRRAAARVAVAGTSLEKQMQKLAGRVPRTAELGAAVVAMEANRHTNLVWHQANRLEKSFPDHHAEDMLGWGWQGLRTAIRLYDPSLGFAFSTYACSRIVGSIRDGVRAENPVPKRLTTYARKVAAAEERLVQELHRSPTLAEVAERIGSELAQIQIMPRLQSAASVEEITANLGEKGGVPGWTVDDRDPLDEIVRREQCRRIEDALALLPAEDAVAVRLLVMEELAPAEARELTGATTRQLRLRSRRGLEALSQHLAGEID